MEKVGVNNFARRQIKGSGKTYSSNLTFEEMALDAQNQMSKGKFNEGYRDGVRTVKASSVNIKSFYCPYVKIDEKTQLVSKVVRRQNGEQPYIQTRAISGTPLDAESVEYILYRNDVLAENDENTTNLDWELISIHAIPKGIKKMPMGPVTMMRNQKDLEGGTKAYYTSEEWADSVEFWQKYAPLSK